MISKKYNEQMGNYIEKLARESKPQTNADRIRGMSDEELAEFLDTVNSCVCSFAMGKSPCDGKDCPCWLSWLKSRAKEADE